MTVPHRLTTLLLLSIPLTVHHASALADDGSVTVGAALAVANAYPGAQERRATVLPYVEWESGSLFASTVRGLGVQARCDALALSAALNVDLGRADHKRSFGPGADRLRGMGDIDAGGVVELGARWQATGGASVKARTRLATRREYGGQLELSGAMPVLTGQYGQVGLAASMRYADRRRMQSWFGVTPAQQASSGFAAYRVGAGVESQSLGLTAMSHVGKGWMLSGEAGVRRLGDHAAASPLVEKRSGPYLMAALVTRL